VEAKYLIDGESVDPDHKEEVNSALPVMTNVRPTGDMLAKLFGRGTYETYRPDGQMLRTYTVRLNRKQTLSVDSDKANGLEALSTLNLERLIKRFEGITKIWPAGVGTQVRKVHVEIERRKTLVDRAQANPPLEAVEETDALQQAVEESRAARETVSA
jgi:hypothetical protein